MRLDKPSNPQAGGYRCCLSGEGRAQLPALFAILQQTGVFLGMSYQIAGDHLGAGWSQATVYPGL
jgi:hypothetical protein